MAAMLDGHQRMRGWYLLHRGWMNSQDFRPEPFTDREAYLWSIEQAAFQDHRQWFNGSQYQVERGEFVTSFNTMMSSLQWSEKRVRNFIKRMIRSGKWARRGAHHGAKAPTIIIVCNYDAFQSPGRLAGEGKVEDWPDLEPNGGRSGVEEQNQTQRIPIKTKKGTHPPPADIQRAVDAWSDMAAAKGWSVLESAQPLAGRVRIHLSRVIQEHGAQVWREGLERAARSDFLGGPDPPQWFTLEFISHPENFAKLLGGKYDRSFASRRFQQPNPWLDARRSLLRDTL